LLRSHEVHVSGAPSHVAHVALQVAQVMSSLVRYSPTPQSNVHVPATESKSAPAKQAVQLVAPASSHVLHVGSHSSHPSDASPLSGRVMPAEGAYLPSGQVATHEPLL